MVKKKKNLTLEEIFSELAKWEPANFGPWEDVALQHRPGIGMIEELGEMAHAHLKHEEQIRMNESHMENLQDAIGDFSIFMLSFAGRNQLDIEEIDRARQEHTLSRYDNEPDYALFYLISYHLGAALHHRLRQEEETTRTMRVLYEINITSELGIALRLMELYCIRRNWDWLEIVSDVWKQVRERDWKKDPETGGIE